MPQRNAPKITVLVNGSEYPIIVPIIAQRAAGGERLDNAILQADPRQLKDPYIRDFSVDPGTAYFIEIRGEDDDGNEFTYFWGQQVRQRFELGDGREISEIIARIEPWHFGNPLWDRLDAEAEDTNTERPTTFNEELDGQVFGNQSLDSPHEGGHGELEFLDAEALRTDDARSFHNQPPRGAPTSPDPNLWKLSEVIRYLCLQTNEQEERIKNPTQEEIAKVVDDDNDLVRNLHVPYGWYLPQILDHVLQPLGYNWLVHLEPGEKPKITLYKRGIGTLDKDGEPLQKVLMLQAPGEALDTDSTNLAAANLEVDLSTTYNDIVGLGDFIEVEATFTLLPAWDPVYDAPSALPGAGWDVPFDLSRDIAGFETGGLVDVYRKWVLNEAGDYSGMAALGRFEMQTPYNFAPLDPQVGFGDPGVSLTRRRRFLPCLTLDKDGHPIGQLHGTKLEYKDTFSGNWMPVSDEVSLLKSECGIYFHGVLPPFRGITSGGFVLQDGDGTKPIPALRITATVQLDVRLRVRSTSGDESPLDAIHTLLLDMPHRFKYRTVDSSSVLQGMGTSEASINDTQTLQDYCDALRFTWDTAALHGHAEIEGVDDFRQDPPYEIGQSLTEIAGRDISFDTRPEGETAYPQIVGLTYHFQRQRTTVQLERFREPPRFLKQAPGFAPR